MEKQTKEWLTQSDYDMDTADYMQHGGRHMYAVFMCHLAIEKALKALYYEKHRKFPPKSHNLIYLLNEIGIKPPEAQGKFIVKLSEAIVSQPDTPRIRPSFSRPTPRPLLRKFLQRERRSSYG
ncbi:MAG: HEPN domain-containing protein [Syntrophobacteraceae bacterium]